MHLKCDFRKLAQHLLINKPQGYFRQLDLYLLVNVLFK